MLLGCRSIVVVVVVVTGVICLVTFDLPLLLLLPFEEVLVAEDLLTSAGVNVASPVKAAGVTVAASG